MAERRIRICDKCGQQDDHPRHVVANRNGPPQMKHIDCCAEDGCEICSEQEVLTEGKRGSELISKLAALREEAGVK